MKQGKQRRRCSVWYCISRMILVGCFAVVTFASLGVLFPAMSHAAAITPPNKMNFQGRLTDASGNPLTGTYDMQFKLYSAVSGGTLLWAETRTAANANAVTITSGLFSVRLGEGTLIAPSTQLNAVVAANAALYFEITVGADAPMTPRSQLATSAYAFNSDTLDGIDSTGFIQNTASQQTANFNISGTGIASILQAATFDANSAGTLSIGTTNATSITLGKSGVATTTAGGLLTSAIDTASAGTLTIGSTNATSIALSQNVTVAANKSLTLAGGTTASRPASPTEGMLWYDTTTKQLLTYSNGKWQADRNTATKVVAASTASQALKDSADYVATGTNDQTIINSALTAAAGGKVYLTEGTYTIGGSISVPNNTTLAGAGAGTVVRIPNAQNGSYSMVTNTDQATGTNITIRDLKLDGNKANQTSGTMNGLGLVGMGDGSGASAIAGAKIDGITVASVYGGYGASLNDTHNSVFSNSKVIANTGSGVYLTASNYNTVTGNVSQGNTAAGIVVTGSGIGNTISGNTSQGNGSVGIALSTGAENNTITGNTVTDSGTSGIQMVGVNNTATGNTIRSSTGVGLLASGQAGGVISGNTISGSGNRGISVQTSSNLTISGNSISTSTNQGIHLSSSNNINVNGNKIHDSYGATANNGINLVDSDNALIANNHITDSSCTTTCYAINVTDAASDSANIAGNIYSGDGTNTASLNNLGTNTIYSGQAFGENGRTIVFRQPNITSAFQVQNGNRVDVFDVDNLNGTVKLGDYNGGVDSVAGKLALGTASNANVVTLQSNSQAGNYTLSVPSISANDTICTLGTANCANGTMFIQNQTASAQAANYWINGTARADTSILTSLVDAASAATLNIGTVNATSITLGKSGVTTTNSGSLTISQGLTGNAGTTISGGVISLNSSSNYATTINGGSSTGTIGIGNSAAGAITLQSASTVGITGTTSVNGLTSGTGTALTVSNSTSTGTILDIKDNTTSVMTVADGGALVARNSANSTAGFSIQNATNYTLFTADTTNSRLIIGTSGGDTTGTLLVLGNKTNEGDPTGVEGAMYYNSSMKTFRCYKDAMWGDCGTHNIEREWVVEDEFFSGDKYSGVSYSDNYFGGGIGDLAWEGYALGASGSVNVTYNDQYDPPTADHPGVVGIGTSTNGTGASLFLSNGMWDGYGSVRLATGNVFKTSVQPQYAAGFDARIGLHNQVESRTNEPTAGIWFGVNATNEWEACYYGKAASGDSNAARCLDTNVATTASWTRLEFRIVSFTTGSIQIDYYINGTKYTPVSNGSIYSVEGGTYGVAPIIQWWNTNTTAKQIAIDYVQIKGTTSAAR